MAYESIELEFKQFRYHLTSLIQAEERLVVLSHQLSGKLLKSPVIKSQEEAKYQSGTKIYKNNLTELMSEEEALIKTRDFHLYAVRKIMHYLQQLTDEEVELLELRYWHRIDIKYISRMTFNSRRTIYRKFDIIFEKLAQCATKFMV